MNKIFNLKLMIAVGLLLALSACEPVRVISVQQDEGINFQTYRTFNFLDVKFRNNAAISTNRKEIQLLKNAISKEMEALNYEQQENPDLWINIGIMIEEKVQTRETDIREAPVYIGQRRYHWEREEVVVNEYDQGTVTIDIIDARRNERIWEGVAAGTITNNLKKLEKRIDEAMRLLFKEFPVEA